MKVLDRIDAGQAPIVMGDGSQAYDFIYVKDIARANIVAMKSDVVDQSFNVCVGKKTSIRELVQMLLELTDARLDIEYQPASQVFVTDRVGDPAHARDVLGFEASTKLRDGLQELIAWRRSRIDAERTL
jgi:UDP-glucose 4-epimerase